MLSFNQDILALLALVFGVIVAITLHEYAHARVAVWNGDYTPKQYKRLTLNPLRHFDPIGFALMMFAGFGYAKPVPVNPSNFKKYRMGSFTVAIAGIATNILFAFFVMPFYILLERLSIKSDFVFKLVTFIYTFFNYFIFINISLAIFNLLPLYPLDGFRILETFTRHNNKITSFLRFYGRYILFALIGVGIIIDGFNLKTYYKVFEYLDILGFIIENGRNFIANGFYKFWLLILGGAK